MTLSGTSTSGDGTRPEDTFKILLATDIHLGYNENDLLAGNDSFDTFEEILMLAVTRDVDFILLGGDLFHKAQPSSNALNRCIKLMHTYALGSKEIKFLMLNDDEEPSMRFSMSNGVNFKDPNMNVSYPIFSIHGNHDDTINNLSALDLLSSTGLVNYFGKWQSLVEVTLDPIILQKNRTKIALYGLSHIPDRRLYNLFKEQKIDISVPSANEDEYFNILVLHQNRADRGAKNYLTMDLLPSNMNLIVWGHEHDCRIEPEEYIDVGQKPRYVTQPGSSVATSLCEGEAIEKKVGILNVCFNTNTRESVFKIQSIPLKTVRPFIFKSIELKNYEDEIDALKGNIRDKIEKFLQDTVDEMINESKKLISGHQKQPKLPLIRLRVQFEETDHLLNVKRFGNKFLERVANPGDVLLFKKSAKRLKSAKVNIDDKELTKAISKREQVDRVEDVVEKYFNSVTDENDKLKLFNIKCLSEMSRLIVDKEDEEGAKQLLKQQVEESRCYLSTHMKHIDQAKEIIQHFRDEKSLEVLEESVSNLLVFKKQSATGASRPSKAAAAVNINNDDSDENMDEDEFESPKAKVTRGRGRGSSTARGSTTRGRESKKTTAAAKTTRGRGRMNIVQQVSMRQSQTQQSIVIDSDEYD